MNIEDTYKKIQHATGEHFNMPGHRGIDMNITAIEKVKSIDKNYRKEIVKWSVNLRYILFTKHSFHFC